MIEFVLITLINALFSAFIILLIERVGYREKIQVRAPKLIAELFSCDFCLSFWTCLSWSVVFSLATCNIMYIGCSIAATPITRKLL